MAEGPGGGNDSPHGSQEAEKKGGYEGYILPSPVAPQWSSQVRPLSHTQSPGDLIYNESTNESSAHDPTTAQKRYLRKKNWEKILDATKNTWSPRNYVKSIPFFPTAVFCRIK